MLYRLQPPNFKAQFATVACEVKYQDQVLFLRCAMLKEFAGFLGLPCGKIELNETEAEAMARELREETGIYKRNSLDGFVYVGARYVRFRNRLDFIYHHFRLELLEKPNIVLCKREHSQSLWIPRSQIHKYANQMIEDVPETLRDETWQ